MIYGYLILNLVIGVMLLFWFHRLQSSPNLDRYFWPAVIWKVINGVLYGAIFLNIFQEGDTQKLFEDASVMAQWALDDPVTYFHSGLFGITDQNLALHYLGQPRALFFSWLITPLVILGGGNYWITAIQLSVLSFTGWWILAAKLVKSYPRTATAAVWCLLFLPSTVFWSTGVSKEAVFMAGWCWLIAYCWPGFRKDHWKLWRIPLYLILVLALFRLKYYYIAVTVPILLATLISWSRTQEGIRYFRWTISLIVLLAVIGFTHPNLQWDNVFAVIQQNSQLIAQKSHSAVLVHYQNQTDPGAWTVMNVPQAWFAGMFRPFIGDWGNLWQNLAAIESILMWILALAAFYRFRAWSALWRTWLPVAIFAILLATLLALSTPNLGTLVRLKIVYQPIVYCLLLAYSPWWERVTGYLNRSWYLGF